VLVKHFVHIFA